MRFWSKAVSIVLILLINTMCFAEVSLGKIESKKASSVEIYNSAEHLLLINQSMITDEPDNTFFIGNKGEFGIREIDDNINFKKDWNADVPDPTLGQSIFSLTASLLYLGGSIYAREYVYENDKDNNFMGTFNGIYTCIYPGILAGAATGLVFAGLTGLAAYDKKVFMYSSYIFIPLGIIAGAITGGIMGYKYRDDFKKNPVLYYIAPTLIVTSAVLTFTF